MHSPSPSLLALALGLAAASAAAQPARTTTALPAVPAGLKVQLFAAEPLVRNPCAIAFDARGRLFVGQGPQYRNPKPETPPDSVILLHDSDGDGVADQRKEFATGLNCIQGLAWKGRDLWIANAPDLTIVRDLDGDDVADEYIRVFTDLGNIEHGVHGLNWAPDGKLYMSKGNSKGLNLPDRFAPQPFRELWGLPDPEGAPALPPPQVFRRGEYRRTYHDPRDDWGKSGGILRCDDLGRNLEIVARGMRNPWDISFDSGFDWLGTDNDQNEGDRIFMPFHGAHFGWAHPWGASWTGDANLATAPVSGPVFHGSGTGVIYYDLPQLPPEYRGVWFINDWRRKTTFAYRPRWDGALVQPAGGRWQDFVRGRDALYQPVDIEIGPEGALYISGWGEAYGAVFRDGRMVNEGRIFRVSWPEAPAAAWQSAKRAKPLAQWTAEELVEDLGSAVRVWNVDAQEELVRRGPAVAPTLTALLEGGAGSVARETWALWALGRIGTSDTQLDSWWAGRAGRISANARIQSLRIAAHRLRERSDPGVLGPYVLAALADPEPRVRFAAVLATAEARAIAALEPLCRLLTGEQDRLTFYAGWQALRRAASREQLHALTRDERAGVRRASLLALLEDDALNAEAVSPFLNDADTATASVAGLWLARQRGNSLVIVDPPPGDFFEPIELAIGAGVKPGTLRWTTDGSEPRPPGPSDREVSGRRMTLSDTTTLKIALYVPQNAPGKRVEYRKLGHTFEGTWTRRAGGAAVALEPPPQPLTLADVLPRVEKGDEANGKRLFRAAGCSACHRAEREGQMVGPELTAIGDKADPRHLIESMLNPNAMVTEGFGLQSITRRDGSTVAGMLKEETNRIVTLIQPDAKPVSVEKEQIAKRESLHLSIMPSFAGAMSAQQMADLTAWLLSLRTAASMQTPVTAAPPVPPPAGAEGAPAEGFAAELKDDRALVSHRGRVVMEFVFRDPAILRPHFRNLRAPDGAIVTRRHPPAAPDPVDHATMHPGLWIAFGDVNGQDFWRNQARIEHMTFSEAPTAREGRLEFATENRFVTPDGTGIGTLTLRIAIRQEGDGYLVTCDSRVKAGERELVFGEQEEMGFGVRLAGELIEKNGGQVRNSDGVTGAKAAWGKVADWCDYSKPIEGRRVGAAVFAHPGNPRRSWWHVRDYGLITANAFGPRAEPKDGSRVVKAGEELRLRYAAFVYSAPAAPDLASMFKAYAAESR